MRNNELSTTACDIGAMNAALASAVWLSDVHELDIEADEWECVTRTDGVACLPMSAMVALDKEGF
jgi:hypothetical protein